MAWSFQLMLGILRGKGPRDLETMKWLVGALPEHGLQGVDGALP